MAIKAMSQRYVRPDIVRRINAMGDAAGGAAAMVALDADELLETARTAERYDGDGQVGDGDWLGRFERLTAGLHATDMHVTGRLMTRVELIRSLRARFRLAAAIDATPAMADEVIVEPIVVTGPARSGTSILFELLALDSGTRSPIGAEVIYPFLDASAAEKVRLAETEQDIWADVQPEFAAIHELRADLPVECVTINAPSFGGSHWGMIAGNIEGFESDPVADMAWHRALLGALQYGREPKQWILKTPGYLMMLDLLFSTYPDAKIVQTHRDPVKTMPSTVSTTSMVRWLRSDEIDIAESAAAIGAGFGWALNQVATRRADGSLPTQFGDVRFTDLMDDPVATIGGAYEQLGMDFDPRHGEAIVAYLRDKPKGKYGTHRYDAADWGFDAAQLRRDLQPYTDHFGVAYEVDID